jgi:hypothetical protein
VWTINPATGIINETDNGGATSAHYTMALNKKFIAGTGTDGYQLFIVQKVVPETTYSATDVQSKSLVCHELRVGNQNHWHYWTGTTDATGQVIISSGTDPSGNDTPGATGKTLSVDANGIVTVSGSTSPLGFLSADKKTLVGVSTHTSTGGTSYDLSIMQVTGQTYTAGTMPALTSVSHTLAASGTYGSFWFHYTNTINSSGVMNLSDWVASNSTTAPAGTYTAYIDASGTVTVDGNPTYNGQMSDDNTFVVGTQTIGTAPFLFYGLTVDTKTSTNTNLYASFSGAGIWKWDGSSWNQLTASNPTSMVASGTTLYGTFGRDGIWEWKGSGWNQLTASNPEAIVASGTILYGDFGEGGIWAWNGAAWNQLTASNPTMMVALGTTLYGTFGSNGIWQWNGAAWNQLTVSNPETIVVSGTTLYGDFGSGGIWQWTGSSWNQITVSNPVNMVTGN